MLGTRLFADERFVDVRNDATAGDSSLDHTSTPGGGIGGGGGWRWLVGTEGGYIGWVKGVG